MTAPARQPSGSRETRLLLATIAVSLVMLAVLARFRFPGHGPAETAEPAPAPLERLASQASYDELASTMADLERRVKPSLVPLHTAPGGTSIVAVRVTPDRAVVWLPPGQVAAALDGTRPDVLGRDQTSGIAIVALEPDDTAVATPRSGAPRAGPRYVAVVDAPSRTVTLRPAYVGATAVVGESVTGRSLLSIAAAPQAIVPGAPLFTFAGTFIGIAARVSDVVTVVPADLLKALAESPPQGTGIDLGIDVQPLTDALARIAGASTGAMVSSVMSDSPSAGLLAAGDVIQSLDGTPVAGPADVEIFAQSRAAGAPVKVAFVRRGQSSTIEIPTSLPSAAATARPDDGPGVTLRTSAGRTTVVSVREGSAAAAAGLARGDVIVSVDGGSADLARAFRVLKAGGGLLLTIERDGIRRVIALEKQ